MCEVAFAAAFYLLPYLFFLHDHCVLARLATFPPGPLGRGKALFIGLYNSQPAFVRGDGKDSRGRAGVFFQRRTWHGCPLRIPGTRL